MTNSARAAAAAVTVAVLAAVVGGCSDNGDGSSSSKSPTPTASGSKGGSPSAEAGTVNSRSGKLGQILVDGQGRTLYLFEADTSDKSTCSGGCAKAWPPATTTGTPKGGGGVKSDLLGTTTRDDGSKQVTYNGHPLYYFEGDQEPGDTNGQGLDQFGAKWFVLDEAGNKVEKPAEDSSSGGGGY